MTDCPFETDVLDAIASHRWPHRADADLRAHVSACASCRDLAEVAGALLHEHHAAHDEAHVPSPAVVWHRAQLRARDEAVRLAARPIGIAQSVAFALAVAVILAAGSIALPWMAAWVPDVSAIRLPSVAAPDIDVPALLSNTTVQIAMAGWLLLAPVAIYLAVSRE